MAPAATVTDQVLDDPRVQPSRYVIYPSGYDDLAHSDRDSWCLTVSDGHVWGWYITPGRDMTGGRRTMNRKGRWIDESSDDERNKCRRYPLAEALALALAHVDKRRINGYTAAEASVFIAARTDAGTDS